MAMTKAKQVSILSSSSSSSLHLINMAVTKGSKRRCSIRFYKSLPPIKQFFQPRDRVAKREPVFLNPQSYEIYLNRGCKSEHELWFVDNPHTGWFGVRKVKTTATTVAIMGGHSEYTSFGTLCMIVYHPRHKFRSNGHTERGVCEEPYIRLTFCYYMGMIMLLIPILTHPGNVKVAATPDLLPLDVQSWVKTTAAIETSTPTAKAKDQAHLGEIKAMMKKVDIPPLLYLCQQTQQMDCAEIQSNFLIANNIQDTANVWHTRQTPAFTSWLDQTTYRGIQYNACLLADKGRELSPNGCHAHKNSDENWPWDVDSIDNLEKNLVPAPAVTTAVVESAGDYAASHSYVPPKGKMSEELKEKKKQKTQKLMDTYLGLNKQDQNINQVEQPEHASTTVVQVTAGEKSMINRRVQFTAHQNTFTKKQTLLPDARFVTNFPARLSKDYRNQII